MQRSKLLLIFIGINWFLSINAQSGKDSVYQFTMVKVLKATPVKNQSQTNTCWSFVTLSLLESELLRTTNEEYDLSEMFIVWNTWQNKAIKYVRMHGNINFAGGGATTDVLDIIRDYGIVHEEAYTGLLNNELIHNHKELDLVLKAYIENLAKTEKRSLSSTWMKGFKGILDSYLGEIPSQFKYKEHTYTPRSFSQQLDINPDDYILLTSFTHHPFYSKFILEVPDNWSWGYVYNVPLEEMMRTVDFALENNYSIAWAADNTEKGFSFTKGVAVMPALDERSNSYNEWQEAVSKPCKEIIVDQALRQKHFDNYASTDDHGMHIIGWAKDQTGKKFYYIKNSWGVNNKYNGYMYISEAYMQLKTISILLNKNAIPSDLRQKLGI